MRMLGGLVMVVFFLICPFSEAKADALTLGESSWVDICYMANRVQSVRVDLERFTVYRQGSRGFWEEETQQALGTLSLVALRVRDSIVSPELENVRQSLAAYTDELTAYAREFQKTLFSQTRLDDASLEQKEFDLRDQLLDILDHSPFAPNHLADIDPWDVEVGLFFDDAARNDFLKANDFLEEKKFAEASAILRALRDRDQAGETWGSLDLRIARVFIQDNDKTVDKQNERRAIDILDGVLKRDVYNPVLYDVFVLWRSLYQGFYYGWGVKVNIPGLLYLDQSERVARTIQRWLAAHPQDEWARIQLFRLTVLPVLHRERDGLFLMP